MWPHKIKLALNTKDIHSTRAKLIINPPGRFRCSRVSSVRGGYPMIPLNNFHFFRIKCLCCVVLVLELSLLSTPWHYMSKHYNNRPLIVNQCKNEVALYECECVCMRVTFITVPFNIYCITDIYWFRYIMFHLRCLYVTIYISIIFHTFHPFHDTENVLHVVNPLVESIKWSKAKGQNSLYLFPSRSFAHTPALAARHHQRHCPESLA